MKKIFFIIFTAFIFSSFLGIADTALAMESLEGKKPTIVYPPAGAEKIPYSPSPTLKWSPPWGAGEEGSYIPENFEVWYQWRIGTKPGSSNIDSSGEEPVNRMVLHPKTETTISVPLSPGTTYYWAVKAKRYEVKDPVARTLKAAGESEWSEFGEFTTKKLEPPTITNPPMDGKKDFPPDSAIEWWPVEGAEVYGWELLWDGEKSSASTKNNKVSPKMEYDTDYIFKVSAGILCEGKVDIEKCLYKSDWGIRTFKTKRPEKIEPPKLKFPADGAVISLPFEIKWEKAVGATTYEWQIRKKIGAEIVASGLTEGLSVNITDKELEEVGNHYLWWVKSCWTEGGVKKCSDFSESREFLLKEALPGEEEEEEEEVLPKPVLLQPKNGATVSTAPVLEWEPVTGAEWYELEIKKDGKAFKTIHVFKTSVDIFEALETTLEAGKTYSWRVRAHKDEGASLWSAPWEFKTKKAADGEVGPVIPGIGITIKNPLEAESFGELIDAIINFLFWIALAIVPLMILIAAMYFITAGGDPKRVDIAKKMILYTAIGFAIILLAKGLISLLKSVLGIKESAILFPLFFSSLGWNFKKFISKRSNKFTHFIKRFL